MPELGAAGWCFRAFWAFWSSARLNLLHARALCIKRLETTILGVLGFLGVLVLIFVFFSSCLDSACQQIVGQLRRFQRRRSPTYRVRCRGVLGYVGVHIGFFFQIPCILGCCAAAGYKLRYSGVLGRSAAFWGSFSFFFGSSGFLVFGTKWMVHIESLFRIFGRAFNCLRETPEIRCALLYTLELSSSPQKLRCICCYDLSPCFPLSVKRRGGYYS